MSYYTKLNLLTRCGYTSILALLFVIIIPFLAFATEVPMEQAKYIAQISESNPYQALVYVLSGISIVCIVGMAYMYNQQMTNIKEQYSILRDVSNNMATLSQKIENSQETIEKSLEAVTKKLSDQPCLLDSTLIKDLLKK